MHSTGEGMIDSTGLERTLISVSTCAVYQNMFVCPVCQSDSFSEEPRVNHNGELGPGFACKGCGAHFDLASLEDATDEFRRQRTTPPRTARSARDQ
jgi:hypothetical protein